MLGTAASIIVPVPSTEIGLSVVVATTFICSLPSIIPSFTNPTRTMISVTPAGTNTKLDKGAKLFPPSTETNCVDVSTFKVAEPAWMATFNAVTEPLACDKRMTKSALVPSILLVFVMEATSIISLSMDSPCGSISTAATGPVPTKFNGVTPSAILSKRTKELPSPSPPPVAPPAAVSSSNSSKEFLPKTALFTF